jgi:hypothetical protein
MENINLHLSRYKQDYQNIHDTHIDQEAASSAYAFETGFPNQL